LAKRPKFLTYDTLSDIYTIYIRYIVDDSICRQNDETFGIFIFNFLAQCLWFTPIFTEPNDYFWGVYISHTQWVYLEWLLGLGLFGDPDKPTLSQCKQKILKEKRVIYGKELLLTVVSFHFYEWSLKTSSGFFKSKLKLIIMHIYKDINSQSILLIVDFRCKNA